MRRRQPTQSLRMPRTLQVYDPSAWWGRDDAERMLERVAARREWAAERDLDELPGDELIVIPDGLFRPGEI